MTVNEMNLDLINAFDKIGIQITGHDIPIILRIGADAFVGNVRFAPSEERMTAIYLILNEMRQIQ